MLMDATIVGSLALLELAHRLAEILDVLEAPIDGSKADVGDLVELVELLHHHLADLARRDLALTESQHLTDDPVDGLVDELRRHRPLVQRPLKTVAQLADVETGARAVGLHYLRQPELDRLVGRKSLLAPYAAAATANGVSR